jgi:hypothetical protein
MSQPPLVATGQHHRSSHGRRCFRSPGPRRPKYLPNSSTLARPATLTIAGKTFAITQAANTATANQRFVELLYFNCFGRLPSAAERDFQVTNGLRPPATRADLTVNFFNSAEFNNAGRFVAGLYVGILNRDAEYGGWLFQRNATATLGIPQAALLADF